MSQSKGKRRHFVSLSSQDDVTVIGHPEAGGPSVASECDVQRGLSADIMPSPKPLDASLDLNPADEHSRLHRGLSTRQVQMIAIAGKGASFTAAKVYSNGLIFRGLTGTIGTGLFLGTSKSLAQGGPASMLIAYSIVGFIVYVTLLLLGEMATQYPVAGMYDCYISSLWCTTNQRHRPRFIHRICP